MLQEQQGRRIQQQLTLCLVQVPQFRKVVVAGQQAFLFQRTQTLLVAPRLQYEGGGQIVESLRLEQHALFSLGAAQAFHIAVVFQVAERRQHLGVAELPVGVSGL